MMERQVSHLVRIVDDLLEISRITRGKLEFQKKLTDLQDVVSAALEASGPNIKQKSHRLHTNLAAEGLVVDADPVRLTQAVINVLNNAAKYTPDGGQIEISTYRQNGQAVIEIRDSGVGIPEEALPYIFDLFAQLGSDCTEYSGLGVGLALVHEIVKAHGGVFEASSGGPNKGSTFRLRLPLAKAATEDAPKGGISSPPIEAARRVLVIDDNRDAAESLSILLESLGASTRVAYDGRSGIEAAKEFEPDVILVDLGMPGLNGFETARLLRESPGGRGRLLAAITGWGQEEHRARTAAAGFDAHLTKPTSVTALQELLARPAPTPPPQGGSISPGSKASAYG